VASKRKNVKQGYLRKRAVVLEPEERRKRFLLQALATIRNDKDKKAKARRSEKLAAREKTQAREQAKFSLQTKLEKKRKYREMGKSDAARKRKRGAA
jgi:ribosome biogenesis protein BMS1